MVSHSLFEKEATMGWAHTPIPVSFPSGAGVDLDALSTSLIYVVAPTGLLVAGIVIFYFPLLVAFISARAVAFGSAREDTYEGRFV